MLYGLGKLNPAPFQSCSNGQRRRARRDQRVDDKQCMHVFESKSQKIACYSDNAVRKMKECLQRESIDDIWAAHRARGGR